MADNNPYTAGNPDTREDVGASAFCQECGRALTSGTLRRVAGGVFCLPCAARRSASSGWQTVPPGAYGNSPAQGMPAAAPQGAGPSPARASVLGFIPGVGAMYNGQYAKAAMHLVVFVGLLTLADHLNWTFYWLVWGWVFYQVFDAYHTARARRDGLPLPNPFGWNEIGDKLGFSSAPGAGGASISGERATSNARPMYQEATSSNGAQPAGVGEPAATSTTAAAGFPGRASEAAGPRVYPFVDPGRPMTAPPFPGPIPVQPGPREVAWQAHGHVPYSPTYTGQAGAPDPNTVPASRRFPAGALWLIGLGTLFLMGNTVPHFAIRGHWLVPILLFGLALWSGVRRMELHRVAMSTPGRAPNLACALVAPVMLLTLSVLMGLQAAHFRSLGRTWPVLLVIWGGMLLAQRAAEAPANTAAPSLPEAMPAPPVRSTSGTGSLGL